MGEDREGGISVDDSGIVDLYLKRDEAALSETAIKYGTRLRLIAFHILENRETAEECENDTYWEAWNLIPPHEPRTYLFPFCGRIIRHLAIDRARSENTKKRKALYIELTKEMEECIPAELRIEESIEEKELIHCINAFLASCTVEQRSIFVRRYWYFDSITSICMRYGYTNGKIKSLLFRHRERLKDYLEKEGYSV